MRRESSRLLIARVWKEKNDSTFVLWSLRGALSLSLLDEWYSQISHTHTEPHRHNSGPNPGTKTVLETTTRVINTLSSFFLVVTNAAVPLGLAGAGFDNDDDGGDVIFSFLISARLLRILTPFDGSRGRLTVGFLVALELEDGAACFSYLASNCSTVASSSEMLAERKAEQKMAKKWFVVN